MSKEREFIGEVSTTVEYLEPIKPNTIEVYTDAEIIVVNDRNKQPIANIRAIVKDDKGNPIKDLGKLKLEVIVFKGDEDSYKILGDNEVEISDTGEYKFQIAFTKEGEFGVGASLEEHPYAESNIANVRAGRLIHVVDKSKSGISVDKIAIVADGEDRAIITTNVWFVDPYEVLLKDDESEWNRSKSIPLTNPDAIIITGEKGQPLIGTVERIIESNPPGVFRFAVTSTRALIEEIFFDVYYDEENPNGTILEPEED